MKLVRGMVFTCGGAAAALVLMAGPANAGGDYDRGGQHSSHNYGAVNGNQFSDLVHIPINVCGNNLALLGLASGSATCVND